MKQIKKLKHFTNFYATIDGDVYKRINKPYKFKLLTRHQQQGKAPFVKLYQDTKDLSLTVGKAILLAYRPNGYKSSLIAVHKDGDKTNTELKNMQWGTRALQSKIAMRNAVNYNRVRDMGRKYGVNNGTINGKKYGAKNLIEWRKKKCTAKQYSEDFRNAVVALLQSGQQKTSIAKLLNIPRSSIYSIIRTVNKEKGRTINQAKLGTVV